jgi:putative transposase
MGQNHDAELVKRALQMALIQRQPGAGLIHHSDRGSEYASKSYQKMLQEHGIQVSMSKKGDCYDNAPIESFWGTRHAKNAWEGIYIIQGKRQKRRYLTTLKHFTIERESTLL